MCYEWCNLEKKKSFPNFTGAKVHVLFVSFWSDFNRHFHGQLHVLNILSICFHAGMKDLLR